jgi:hypothetical protein
MIDATGGTEHVALEIGRVQARRGHEVTIASMAPVEWQGRWDGATVALEVLFMGEGAIRLHNRSEERTRIRNLQELVQDRKNRLLVDQRRRRGIVSYHATTAA